MSITTAQEFGLLVRSRRKALGLTQEELAERCGFGHRFILELEAGKPSCQLDKALTVAREVGIDLVDAAGAEAKPDLPAEDDELGYVPSFP